MPHPLETTPFLLGGGGFLLALVVLISPPNLAYLTSAALVFLTVVLPLEPSRFFFLAVEAL
jgi:hypothetical protein